MADFDFRKALCSGLVIPAHPLALTEQRKLDERRQRALSRYYLASGAGGLAVGVHTTQFAIRDPSISLYEPVLALAAEEMTRSKRPIVRIGGICGGLGQAIREAELLRRLGYDVGLLSFRDLKEASNTELIEFTRRVGAVIPVMGFYLQPAVGGRSLDYDFWCRFLELDCVVAIKVAAFNRYATFDVMRAVAASNRKDVGLYTGNDDNIIPDLMTPFRFGDRSVRFVGGLLGQWAVGTRRAVSVLERCKSEHAAEDLLALGGQLTDMNAAVFDVDHHFAGCIAGVHEVLRREGLLEGTWCLNPDESLSQGQQAAIARVCNDYPHLLDSQFIAENRDDWLR